ncbi:hypothetical protein OHA99_20405 [Streptomyces coelicoflavus]|uniref:hypothetical protein n=1 Tax=Streptomyces TaxID=1883 RepID=UPI001292181D|nr:MULTISPECIES: hypothetical protein [Streptomyces]MCX5036982.1 hypothetical protein [Streptomyces coelicoflavus]QFX83165.1 hypothetical protein GEV49_21375 [Streptomyces sp. SYP-A7193]
MTVIDPLVPALAEVVVDAFRFLESCDDDEVDPDSAVKLMEGMSGELLRLPPDQRARLLQALADLTEAEQDPGRREFLESFRFACGLVEEPRD